MNDRILSLMGLCKRAGKLVCGEEPVMDAIAEHNCRLVITASDISAHSLRKLTNFCGDRVSLMTLKDCTKEMLGGALGWKSCAAAGVQDMGFALRLAQMIAAEQPECVPTMEAIAAKQDKMLRRKQEKPRRKRPTP